MYVFQCLNMEEEELKNRTVDRVDILTDPVDEKHYKEEEVRLMTAWMLRSLLEDVLNDFYLMFLQSLTWKFVFQFWFEELYLYFQENGLEE